jgi:(p)ppGpp synthase/HD superfamily hydrolase
MNDLVRVMKASDAAARWHVDQRRKGAAREPYINHLLEVASLVAEATGGDDPDLVVAALLHDAMEDQGVSREELAREFGEAVAGVVAEVTDDKALAKAERKRLQIEHAPKKSPRAAMVKLADKTSNLRAVARSPAENWSTERRLDYVRWARDVVQNLPKANAWLEAEFARAAEDAERAARESA